MASALKQPPRAWFDRLKGVLVTLGFTASKCDPSLFVYTQATHIVYMLVYVDDIMITGNSISLIQQLISQLHSSCALKQLGDFGLFFGY